MPCQSRTELTKDAAHLTNWIPPDGKRTRDPVTERVKTLGNRSVMDIT